MDNVTFSGIVSEFGHISGTCTLMGPRSTTAGEDVTLCMLPDAGAGGDAATPVRCPARPRENSGGSTSATTGIAADSQAIRADESPFPTSVQSR